MDWQGRRVLLTGAGGGLGPVIGSAMAGQGAQVAITALTEAETAAAAAVIGAAGTVLPLQAGDVAAPRFRAGLMEAARDGLGGIDVLVNCAGIEAIGRFERARPGAIETSLAVNLGAAMDLTRLALPGMLGQGAGHIVNIASLAGVGTPPFLAIYSATKAGLIGFTRSLRSELQGRGVSASAICPGFVRGGGMYQRKQDRMPVAAPRLLGTTTREAVAAAVIRAVRRDLAEPIVNPGPSRVLAAILNGWPALAAPLARYAGVADLLRQWADRVDEAARGGEPE